MAGIISHNHCQDSDTGNGGNNGVMVVPVAPQRAFLGGVYSGLHSVLA